MATKARHSRRTALALAGPALAVTALAGALPALSHPHVWVATKTQVLFENGAVTGLRYTWLFDEMYTANAVEGLDKNKDGKLDRAELDELTKVNMEGLKEFEYFTSLVVGGEPGQFADPKDYFMEVTAVDEAPGPQLVGTPAAPAAQATPQPPAQPGMWSRFSGWIAGLLGRSATVAAPAPTLSASAPAPEKPQVLALHMTLPLKAPVPAAKLDGTAKGLQFTLTDAQMFIWFEPLPKVGLTLSEGAPAGCRALLVEPEMDEQQKKLAEAFGRVGAPGISTPGKAATVTCK